EPTHAAAEGEAADAGVRHVSGRGGQTVALRLDVERAEQRTTLHPGAAAGRVHLDTAHHGQVDHDPAVRHREAEHAVPAAAHADLQVEIARGTHRGDHVPDAGAPDDHPGTPVDHRVPHGASLVVLRVARHQHVPVERLA